MIRYLSDRLPGCSCGNLLNLHMIYGSLCFPIDLLQFHSRLFSAAGLPKICCSGTTEGWHWCLTLLGSTTCRCVMFMRGCVSCVVCESHFPLFLQIYVLPLLLLLAAKPESAQPRFCELIFCKLTLTLNNRQKQLNLNSKCWVVVLQH